MNQKLAAAVLLLVIALAAGIGQTLRDASAQVTGITAPDTEVVSGDPPILLQVSLNNVEATEDVTVTIFGLSPNPSVEGTLTLLGCAPAPGCPADLPQSTSADATAILVETDNLSQLTLQLQLTCTAAATVVVTASTPGDPAHSAFINCTPPAEEPPPGGGGGGLFGGLAQVSATANPNLLPCEGGTSIITAEVVDALGVQLEDATFRFATTAGQIEQLTRNTARLTLGPNQTSATVSAFIPDPGADDDEGEVDEAQVVVSLACNDAPVLVVTASPNVIDCTGSSKITASVRDENGHVVPGRGFHFITDKGLLTVHPNTANNEEGVATLSLRPGDGNATVIVTSGLLHGTIEDLDGNENNFVVDETALVTVQQNCLGTTTGQIKVNASQKDVACGQNVFVGLSVVDEDIQTVVDQTPMTLIATHGGFYGGLGEGGVQNVLPAAQVPTSHGEANTIYTAPTNYNGEVLITAASGDVYGYQKLNVFGCTTIAPANGAPPANGGTGPAPCVPIGDGVCITPPNTGRSAITPPNTGSAGLK